MVNQDELAQLETERDRLQSMIAYHNGSSYGRPSQLRAHGWFVVVAVVLICGVAGSLIAAVFAGQLSPLGPIAVLAGLALLAYILSRRVTLFGVTFFLGEVFSGYPTGHPVGENEARERLAKCEAQIVKLRKRGE